MEMHVTKKIDRIAIASILLLAGCVSSVSEARVAVDDPQAVYHQLLAKLKRSADAMAFLTNDGQEMEVATRNALISQIRIDPIARSSLLAKCGLIDVISCFETQPTAEVMSRQPKGENFRLACIRYTGRKDEDWLIAYVYFIEVDKRWKLLSSSKHYFEKKSMAIGEKSCWADQQK
jgi:hypothetical protein